MRKLGRVVGAVAGVLLLVLVLAGVAAAGLAWWSLPAAHTEAAVPGLSGPVSVGIDADGVPRIEARTAADGAAALGFLHARDRMFQMELMRRAASGRLSEIAGAATLRLDRVNRVLGLRRRAEADLPGLDADTRALLDAYAAGVNAWIAARGRFAAPEFVVLGAPEPWTPVDSLLWGKTMALYLSGNWRQELLNLDLARRIAPERVRRLWPRQDDTPAPQAALLPAPPVPAGSLAALLGAVPAFPAPFTQPSTASNEWAVDGRLSATGAPLLAGDPHLGLSMPAVWYLARITTPDGVLAGATAPGMPFLVIGHNGRVAWTFTTAGADTQDLFVETPDGDGYAAPGGRRAFEAWEERIAVRGGADVVMTVRETRHGPVISDALGEADAGGPVPGPVLALAAANLQPGDTAAAGLRALNRAGSLVEVEAAAARITAPVQNLLAADRDGIGQFTTGRVPLRRAGDGKLPAAGADGAADWTGFASGRALPFVLRPESGRIVNGNERAAPADFPVFLGADWFGDWRARRIRALLEARTRHSVQGFGEMQVDGTSAFATGVLPRLLRTEPKDAASRAALAALRRWDGAMRTSLPQPLLFNEWMRRFGDRLLKREDLPQGAMGAGADAVARALAAEAEWCGAGCGALLSDTLAEAAAAADGAEWGERHRAVFRHPLLGRLPLLGELFTWTAPQPGDNETVFRGGSPGDGWSSLHGPAFRGVYDLADLDRSRFALAPGQSGHPFRRHAGDLVERWRGGTTLRLGPTAPAVEQVLLRPAAGGGR